MKRYIRNGVIDVEKLTELWKSNVPEKFVNTFAPQSNRYNSLLKKLDIEFYVKDDILHVGLIVDYDLQNKSLEKDLHKLQYLFREITGIGDLINEHGYDGLVILTDGYAPPPKFPDVYHPKVLWVCENEKCMEKNGSWMENSVRVCVMELD